MASGKTQTVLVVEDEASIASFVSLYLKNAGYSVRTAANGTDALAQAGTGDVDLVVLDLMLPGRSGLDVLAELRRREETRDVGVILLTARREEVDRIKGLAEGADDYLTKPFSPDELVLRVKAVLRRLSAPAHSSGAVVKVGPIVVDRAALTVTVDGVPAELTPIEYRLLLTLVERQGRVQSRPHLLETVWQAQPDLQTRTVDMHVNRLRAKLGAAGDLIETVRGFGYRLREPEAKERRR